MSGPSTESKSESFDYEIKDEDIERARLLIGHEAPGGLPEPDDALKAKAVAMMQRHRAIEKQRHREALGG
jgi:hypothetical protein